MSSDLIKFTLLANEEDNEVKPAELPWADFVTLMTTHDRRVPDIRPHPRTGEIVDMAKFGTAFVPATYNGPLRRNNNVSGITVATFDLDGVAFGPGETPTINPKTGRPNAQRPMTPAEWAEMLGRVDASGYAAFVHSSYRYSPDKPKGRVGFRVSRPMMPGEWPLVRDHLDKTIGLNCDPGTKDSTRLYFLPAAPVDAPVFAAVTDGTGVVDVDEICKGQRVEALTASINAHANARTQAALEAARAAQETPVDLDLLRKMLKAAEGSNSSMLKAALKGEPVAAEGGRDNALNALCAAARFAVPPNTPTAALLEIFRESILALPHNAGENWFEEARKKLDRHQERRIVHDSARQAQHDEAFSRLRREAARSAQAAPRSNSAKTDKDGGDSPGSSDEPDLNQAALDLLNVGPYEDVDLAKWAQDQGCADILDFQKRWVISRGNAHYLFVEGRYLSPVPRENLEHSIQRDLSRAPVSLTRVDGKGNLQIRDVRAVLHDYSTVARATQADLALQRSFYEPYTQTFHEAVTPLRNLEARAHAEVQEWLELLDPSGKVIDWVASVPRLDRQLCAIYLDGPAGVGKTLLATGLARLWTTGAPSALNRILDGFNESIIQCPLILADEGLPQRKGITAEIRNLIGTTSRTLNRKFLPMVSLAGSLRLVIAGNNDRLLDTGEELSTNDLEAVASRIYYLKTDRKPAEHLHAIGGPPRIQRWIDQDMLAEHALYLRNTVKVNESSRFLVEGNPGAFHRHLAMGSGVASTVCEWLVRHLADPNPPASTLVLVGSGELWVNTEALAKEASWLRYVPSGKVPSANQISRALRGVAIGSITAAVEGREVTYHRIDPDLIVSFVERLQIGDPNAIRIKINTTHPVIASTPRA